MSKKARAHLSMDPVFKEIIDNTKLERRVSNRDVYSSLIRTIIFQQLSGKAASTIHGRFLDLFPDEYPHPEQLARFHQNQLTAVGLSRQKSSYVQNVATCWMDNSLEQTRWNQLEDDEIVELLTDIKGVGPWTAQIILMFTLERPDVFPINDLGIRNAVVKGYRLRSKGRRLDDRIGRIAESWRPYRTLACRYLWQWLDQ